MLLYRIIRWINEVYPVTVLFLYIGLALATFIVCFLMPVAAILSLVFAIFALVPAVAVWQILQASERWLAREGLRDSRCPCCGSELPKTETDAADCVHCGAAFETSGARVIA